MLVSALAAAALAGCATTASVHADYVKATTETPKVDGHAVIMVDRKQTLTGNPESLTGAALTLTEPVGEIMATTAKTVLDAGFSGQSELADQPKPDAYAVALRVQGFSYKFDQLSNLGFAITPKVTVAVAADVTAPQGRGELHKTYERKDFKGETYLMSFNPTEKVNRALHLALADILQELMRDIAALKGP